MQVHFTAPILRIFDESKAKEFYLDYLGFTLEGRYQPEPLAPVYLRITRDGCILHLTEHYGDCCPGSTVYLRVSELESYHREITAKNYPYLRPGLETTPWNSRMLEVTDPFGNRLRFDEPLP